MRKGRQMSIARGKMAVHLQVVALAMANEGRSRKVSTALKTAIVAVKSEEK